MKSSIVKIGYLAFILIIACNNRIEKTLEKPSYTIEILQRKSPVNSSIRGISIVDNQTAWLSGAKGNVLLSKDGGKTWTLLNSPDDDSLDFRSIHAFDDKTAIIASAGFPCRMYKTINGGISWKLLYENLDSAAFINSIAFKSESKGIVIGDQLNGRHLILISDDNGENWTRIDSSFIPKPLPIENGFAASGSCIAIDHDGNYYIGLGGEQSRVFSSSDGKTWNAAITPMVSGSPSKGIYALAAGNKTVMAVGGDYTEIDSSYYSVYYNSTKIKWEKTNGLVSGYRSAIDYSDLGNFWICGGTNGIEITYDDGNKWERISDIDINTLRAFPNSSRILLATKKGDIYTLDVRLTLKKD